MIIIIATFISFSWKSYPLIFQVRTSRITRPAVSSQLSRTAQGLGSSGQMKHVLHHCLKPELPPTKLFWMCLCCTLSFLDYIAGKRTGDTFLHILRGIRHPWLTQFQRYLAICLSQGLLKIPGREGVGNHSQSPKSKLEPPAQLPSAELLCPDFTSLFLTPLNVYPLTACLHASQRKLLLGESPHTVCDFTKKPRTQTPTQRRKKRTDFYKKGELLMANESVFGVCVF